MALEEAMHPTDSVDTQRRMQYAMTVSTREDFQKILINKYLAYSLSRNPADLAQIVQEEREIYDI